jgi:hypothetical protein
LINSEDVSVRSDYAFDDADEMMTNFKEIFENPNQKYFKTPGTRIRP